MDNENGADRSRHSILNYDSLIRHVDAAAVGVMKRYPYLLLRGRIKLPYIVFTMHLIYGTVKGQSH